MRHIKESLEPDFFVDPKPLTEDGQKRISDYIKADKEKRSKLKISKKKGAFAQSSQATHQKYPCNPSFAWQEDCKSPAIRLIINHIHPRN